MDKSSFVRDLLSDPQSTISAYREGGEHDEAIEELIRQVTHLEERLREALGVPTPEGLAAAVIQGVQDREDLERELLSDPESAIRAYRHRNDLDSSTEEVIQQVKHLEESLREAMSAPAPTGLAAAVIKGVEQSERERAVLERALMTEPAQAIAQFDESAGPDELAQAMVGDAKNFERSLENALAVAPPTGLDETLVNHVQRAESDKRPRGWITAVAASVFAVVGIALIVAPKPGEAAKLRQAFSEHITHEEPGAMTSFDPVSERLVASMFSDFGAQTAASFGEVHYAQKCPIGDSRGVHLVMQQSEGPVTFLFLPNESLDETLAFETEGGVTGRMFPLANGVAALFGHKGQSLEALDQRISGAFEQAIASTLGTKVGDQG